MKTNQLKLYSVNEIKELVIRKAHQLGFDLVGFSEYTKLDEETDKLEKWLGMGYQAGMEYMQKNQEKKRDIKKIFPDAKSIISLGYNYYTPHKHSNNKSNGKISRYAWGKDYHLIIWEKLSILEKYLKETISEFDSKSYVDTGPVMDKVWAVKSGIGWMGKHSNVINRNSGSWFFIATLITDFPFPQSDALPDYCGNCTACIDACPTDAIVSDYVVDSNKCISYLTIENKNDIPLEFKNKFDNWLFGCDICQDVCPWNKKFSVVTSDNQLNPNNGRTEFPLNEIIDMSQEDFKNIFSGSPIKRAKLKGLKRNARFILQDD